MGTELNWVGCGKDERYVTGLVARELLENLDPLLLWNRPKNMTEGPYSAVFSIKTITA